MKYMLLVGLLVGTLTSAFAKQGYPDDDIEEYIEEPAKPVHQKKIVHPEILRKNSSMTISVTGEGVAPSFAISPSQGYALAKRAATADAYRLIAEKVNGVVVEGKDSVQNMVMKRSVINTHVEAMIRNATIVETTFKNGLCEVEMEIRLNYSQFE